MVAFSRREFLKLSAKFTALLGLSESFIPEVTDALERLSSGNPPVLWLSAQACSGCSVSLLNTENPGADELLTKYLSLLFHPTISTATGSTGIDIIHQTIKVGDFFLVVEGSVPLGMPEACVLGGKPISETISAAAKIIPLFAPL